MTRPTISRTIYAQHLLTPWFPGHVKPARPGVYMRYFIYCSGQYFSLFDGQRWRYGSDHSDRAAAKTDTSSVQDLRWRGLAENWTEAAP